MHINQSLKSKTPLAQPYLTFLIWELKDHNCLVKSKMMRYMVI